jgi:hypothetical protein
MIMGTTPVSPTAATGDAPPTDEEVMLAYGKAFGEMFAQDALMEDYAEMTEDDED